MTWTHNFIRAGLGLASVIAPRQTGQRAFDFFCTPPQRRTPTPSEERLIARMAPVMAEAHTATVAMKDAAVTTYLWPATQGRRRGRILLVHGWTGRALVMGAFITPLRTAGFEVVALDLPGHGASGGTRLNLAIGARAVLAVADALGPFDGAITHSFGGPVTLLAAEGGLPLDRGMTLGRMVMIAAPNSLQHITRSFGATAGLGPRAIEAMEAEVLRIAGRPIGDLRCDAFLQRLGIPALIIHDTGDAEVGIADAEAIVAAAPAARLMRTEKLGHRRIIFAPEVVAAAVAFLSGEAGAPSLARSA